MADSQNQKRRQGVPSKNREQNANGQQAQKDAGDKVPNAGGDAKQDAANSGQRRPGKPRQNVAQQRTGGNTRNSGVRSVRKPAQQVAKPVSSDNPAQEKLLAAQAELSAAWERADTPAKPVKERLPTREFGAGTERKKVGKAIAYHAGGATKTPQRTSKRDPRVTSLDVAQSDAAATQQTRGGRGSRDTGRGRLKIIPLGGLLEIGKNMTVYEYAEDIIVVDAGMAFPEDDMLGIDLVMPDITYLQKNKHKIRGIFITHGHEDHIGALSYVLREMNLPIFSSPFARALIESKLDEAGLLRKADLVTIKPGEVVKAGVFSIEAIGVNHSTPDAQAYAITTPLGVVIQMGDFKIDTTPVGGEMIDLARFGEYGKKGVTLLLSDSTNVERPGYTMSEKSVGETFDTLFQGCKQRLIVTTFASNAHRIQQIIEAAVKVGRKVAISGRSMEKVLGIAVKLGYITIPNGTLLDMAQINSQPPEKLVIITTGSQGETLSALYRMAFGTHRQVQIGMGDKVVLSASPIPGNENSINKVINELFRRGADVVYERLNALHVSGHACQEELKIILGLTKPKYFMPVHGEYKMLRTHGRLAASMGVSPKNIFIMENGRILEITPQGAKLQGSVQAGAVLLDGSSSEDVGGVVLRDRQLLAEDGVIMVAMTLDKLGNLVAGPEIVTRGFVYVKESDGTISSLEQAALQAYEKARDNGRGDWTSVKSAVKGAVSDMIYRNMRRRPMVLPTILQITGN